MVDINKLKGKIVENGLTVALVAAKIGIDHSTFYRKMSDQGERFTLLEVNLICKTLRLSKEEAMSIFFNNIVA